MVVYLGMCTLLITIRIWKRYKNTNQIRPTSLPFPSSSPPSSSSSVLIRSMAVCSKTLVWCQNFPWLIFICTEPQSRGQAVQISAKCRPVWHTLSWEGCHSHCAYSRSRRVVKNVQPDEEGGEDEEGGQVHRDNRLKEEVLEEVGGVDDAEHLRGRCRGISQMYIQHGGHYSRGQLASRWWGRHSWFSFWEPAPSLFLPRCHLHSSETESSSWWHTG